MANKNLSLLDYSEITGSAPIALRTHGWRAKCLQRLVRLDLPVPKTVALSFNAVRAIASGRMPELGGLVGRFDEGQLLSVRPSAENPDWGGPSAILNIGMNDERHAAIAETRWRAGGDRALPRLRPCLCAACRAAGP
jgi:pyruvate phosphate dikinase (EC 2.7.9.1)